MNPKINRPKGFGFVTFASTEEATKAVSQENHDLDERSVRVSYAKVREEKTTSDQLEKGKKLYIGKLPWEVNQEELKSYFEKFGPVEDAFLPTVSKYASLVNGYPVHKGFGFITFTNEEDANKAALHKSHVFKTEPIYVRKAKPQEEGRSPKTENRQSPSGEKKQVVVKRKDKQGDDKKHHDKHGKKDSKHHKEGKEGKEGKEEKHEHKDHTSHKHASPTSNKNTSAKSEHKHDEKSAPKGKKTESSSPTEQPKSKPPKGTKKKKIQAHNNSL